MQYTLKLATPDDAERILEIANHPEVVIHQHEKSQAKDVLLHICKFDNSMLPHYHVIVDNQDTIVGYITTFFTGNAANLGWDLHPEYWGNGIICEMLKQHIPLVFERFKVETIQCGCFEENQRCVRVIEKAGFRPKYLGLFGRILAYLFSGPREKYFYISKND